MVGPFVLLVLDVQADMLAIWILACHKPALDAREDLASLDAVGVKPAAPFLQIFTRADAPGDGVPALLGRSLRGLVPYLHDQLCRRVLEHDGEQLVLWRVVVVVR